MVIANLIIITLSTNIINNSDNYTVFTVSNARVFFKLDINYKVLGTPIKDPKYAKWLFNTGINIYTINDKGDFINFKNLLIDTLSICTGGGPVHSTKIGIITLYLNHNGEKVFIFS